MSAVGAVGESLSTREVVAINKAGQIQVCWVVPVAMNATSYNIYRSLASDGRANTATAIAYEVTSGNSCFNEPAGQQNFGLDGVLYFSYLYPFAAIARETVSNPGTVISFLNSSIGRFPIVGDLTAVVADQILASFQSAST